MRFRITDAALVASTLVLSYAAWSGGRLVPIVYAVLLRDEVDVNIRLLMPPITRVASDFAPVFAALICLTGLATAAFSRTRPAHSRALLVAGLSVQGLILWLAAFCFCFESFTGGMCLHHGPHFEVEQFMCVAWGGFPVTLIALLVPLLASVKEWISTREPNKALLSDAVNRARER